MSNCKCGKKVKKTTEYCRECYNNIYGRGVKTKGDYLKNMNNWWEARIPIAKHARKVFDLSGKESKCVNCGYDKHIEICHIKPVSEFLNETTLNEINDITNLVALCRNCHWEFDNDLLKL